MTRAPSKGSSLKPALDKCQGQEQANDCKSVKPKRKRGRPKKQPVPPEPPVIVQSIRPTDILHGRGLPFHTHPANVRMKKIVAEHKQQYKRAQRKDKRAIILAVLREIRTTQADQPVARFVKSMGSGDDKVWCLATEKEAYMKVSHALRENNTIPSPIPPSPPGEVAFVGPTQASRALSPSLLSESGDEGISVTESFQMQPSLYAAQAISRAAGADPNTEIDVTVEPKKQADFYDTYTNPFSLSDFASIHDVFANNSPHREAGKVEHEATSKNGLTDQSGKLDHDIGDGCEIRMPEGPLQDSPWISRVFIDDVGCMHLSSELVSIGPNGKEDGDDVISFVDANFDALYAGLDELWKHPLLDSNNLAI